MYYTTGFSREQIDELCVLVAPDVQAGTKDTVGKPGTYPKILGLFTSMVIALTSLRRNRYQQELAETYGVSQSTISRAVTGLTEVVGQVLATEFVPTAEDLHPDTTYIVDGSLLTCWSWSERPSLYSGKHKTTGMSVQVAATLSGELAWISDPTDGNRHDSSCLTASGVLTGLDPGIWIGDKGYIGLEMIAPIRKPAHRDLTENEKNFNTQINKIRYVIEQVIANFKTWKIMHTDYRRPIKTFTQTISTVIALHFYKITCE